MDASFPKDKPTLNRVLRRYVSEIQTRTSWARHAAEEFNILCGQRIRGQITSSSELFRKIHEILIHGTAVVRLLNPGSAWDEERAQERVRLIRQRCPHIPEIPPSLKCLRNDMEHFEERLDEWAVDSQHHNIEDFHVGRDVSGLGDTMDYHRRFHKGVFHFWDHAVDLEEVMHWLQAVSEAVSSL